MIPQQPVVNAGMNNRKSSDSFVRPQNKPVPDSNTQPTLVKKPSSQAFGPCPYLKKPSGCKYPKTCKFNHDAQETNIKKEICPFFLKGICTYGDKCRKLHHAIPQTNEEMQEFMKVMVDNGYEMPPMDEMEEMDVIEFEEEEEKENLTDY